MTTARSVEPPTGIDAFLEGLFPWLAGAPPEPGERGVDRHMRWYVFRPETGWTPDLPWYAGLGPGFHSHAVEVWNGPAQRQADAEAEAG